MTDEQFIRRIASTKINADSKTAQGCRLVLVDGMTAYAAAKQLKITQPAISQALDALRKAKSAQVCPKCLRPFTDQRC